MEESFLVERRRTVSTTLAAAAAAAGARTAEAPATNRDHHRLSGDGVWGGWANEAKDFYSYDLPLSTRSGGGGSGGDDGGTLTPESGARSSSSAAAHVDASFAAFPAAARRVSIARRGSQRLAQYISWQRAVAVTETLFSRLEGYGGSTTGTGGGSTSIVHGHKGGGTRSRACGHCRWVEVGVLRPDSLFALVWAVYIAFITLTYVAVLEPVLIAFDAPLRMRGPPWRWSAVADFLGEAEPRAEMHFNAKYFAPTGELRPR